MRARSQNKIFRRHSSARVVIVGGGIAGLSTAVRLAQGGLPVTVLESSQLGGGATMRTQGWLHSGAWFAPQRPELARMCYESLQQTLRFCPESVEDNPAQMVFMTSRSESDPQTWTQAWQAAGIPYQSVEAEGLFQRFPGLAISQAHHAFELPDRAVHLGLLLGHLVEAAEAAGVEIRSSTAVERLVYHRQSVQGVETASGETIRARLVILAGNAQGGSLYPGFGAQAVGERAEIALVPLKTHLLGLQPMLSQWPLCVVDAEGLNHLPHQPMSVFGTNRWLPVRHGEDRQVVATEVERIWQHVRRLFPDLEPSEHQVGSWAGTTVQAMHVEDVPAAQYPRPMVVDHQQESEPVENLLSIFPGRATLWAQLAEQTYAHVRDKLGRQSQSIARPPWATSSSPANATR